MTENETKYARLDGGETPCLETSLWDSLAHAAAENADSTAVVSRDQPKDLLEAVVGKSTDTSTTGLSWTYSQLLQGAMNIAAVLQKRDVKPQSILLAFLPPICAEWSLLWWTVSYLGITLVTVDVRALEPARHDELTFYLRSLKPETVVVYNSRNTEPIDQACEELQIQIKFKLTLDAGGNQPDWTGLASLDLSTYTDDIPPIDLLAARDPNRTAIILFTSGTSTGQPKGCPLTEQNLAPTWILRNIFSTNQTYRPKIAVTFANSRAINLHLGNECWLLGGSITYVSAGFSFEGFLQTIEQEEITDCTVIPPQLFSLLRHPGFEKQRVKSLRRVFVGGDIITANLQDAVCGNLPVAGIVPVYAMTEGFGFIGWPLDHVDTSPRVPTSKGLLACGKVMPGSVVKVVGDGKVLKLGQVGDIHIKSASMIRAYHENRSSASFYTDEDGHWFVTGDTGFVDETEHLFVLGRTKDIMKRIGIPVPPILLENIFATFANVQVSATLLQVLLPQIC